MATSNSASENSSTSLRDQQHPQYATDRDLLNQVMARVQEQLRSIDPPDRAEHDWVLAEVARLRIRYQGFPGARDLQRDLDEILQQWGMSEEDLFAQTRKIHERGQVYNRSFSKRDDWA